MRLFYLLPLLVIGVTPTISDDVRAAAADLARIDAKLQPHIRYLSTQAIADADHEEFVKVLAFHCNSLSREAYCVAPV